MSELWTKYRGTVMLSTLALATEEVAKAFRVYIERWKEGMAILAQAKEMLAAIPRMKVEEIGELVLLAKEHGK